MIKKRNFRVPFFIFAGMIIRMKQYFKDNKQLFLFYVVLNVLIALFITMSSYVHVPLNSVKGVISYAVHFCLLQFTLFGFTYFLTLNKYVFYSVFSILFLFFSFIGFWGYTQDVVVTDGVIQSSLEVKSNIMIELANVYVFVYLLASIIALILIIRLYNRTPEKFNIGLMVTAILAIGAFFYINIARNETFSSRLPYSVFNGLIEYAQKPEIKYTKIPKGLVAKNSEVNVIFILGESVRADHLGLNGYKRNTTPLLNKVDGLVSFKNLKTERYFSAISIPQILSDEPMEKPNVLEKASLTEVLTKAGIYTSWIANQVSEVSFDYHIKSCNQYNFIDPFHSVFSYKKASDLDMIPYLKKQLQAKKQQFILLHMMGSHWMYNMRYEKNFEKFKPVAGSKYIPSNTVEEMINSYDNTILVLDYFMNEVIHAAKAKNDQTVIIYLSDHGESLGENGNFLHAESATELLNPAGMIWFSPKFIEANKALYEKVLGMKNQKIQLDFLFPTILDLFEIQGFDYNKQKSLFYYTN